MSVCDEWFVSDAFGKVLRVSKNEHHIFVTAEKRGVTHQVPIGASEARELCDWLTQALAP